MQENEFPINFFPEDIQDIILEVCAIYKFNPDFLSASILATASSSIGNAYSIKVKEGWIERNSLFMAIVASPGINKSAPLSWALRPIQDKEKQLFKEYKETLKEFEENPENADKPKPILLKTIISDATPEAVVQQLYKNERGLLIYNDELSGFLKTFQRYNKGNDEEFYLSVWSGKPVVVDRKTATSIRINEPVINIIGTIQPAVFQKSFATKEESGFFDRWLIINPRNALKECWTDEDLRPEVYESYKHIIDKLQSVCFNINQYDETESNVIAYDRNAWALLRKWQANNTKKINDSDQDHIKGIRAKMEIYVHRFATVCHLLHYACDEKAFVDHYINEQEVESAILLCDYFINNAIEARSGDPSDRMPDSFKQLYDSLPEDEGQFSTKGFYERAQLFDISKSSAKRWLNSQTGKLIIKVRHGIYAKK